MVAVTALMGSVIVSLDSQAGTANTVSLLDILSVV